MSYNNSNYNYKYYNFDLSIEDEINDEIINLMLKCINNNKNKNRIQNDNYTNHSKYATIKFNNKLIAVGRISFENNKGEFLTEEISKGKIKFDRFNQKILDFNRICIEPIFRKNLIYEALLLWLFKYAEDNGYTTIIGTQRAVNHLLNEKVKRLGFSIYNNNNSVFKNKNKNNSILPKTDTQLVNNIVNKNNNNNNNNNNHVNNNNNNNNNNGLIINQDNLISIYDPWDQNNVIKIIPFVHYIKCNLIDHFYFINLCLDNRKEEFEQTIKYVKFNSDFNSFNNFLLFDVPSSSSSSSLSYSSSTPYKNQKNIERSMYSYSKSLISKL